MGVSYCLAATQVARMNAKFLYKIGYAALRVFHWTLFLTVAALMFGLAGWMILGVFGYPDQGRIIGACAGVALTGYVLGRYAKPPLK